MSLCMCGCGQAAPIATGTDARRGNVKGQPQRYILGHRGRITPRLVSPYRAINIGGRIKREHVVIAERALGHDLPKGAVVHHVDGNTNNNANNNLLICQDQAYHALIHARARVLAAGGHPDVHKICCYCKEYKPLSEFYRATKRPDGRTHACIPCSKSSASYYQQTKIQQRPVGRPAEAGKR